jgi:hypothetical protein
MDHQNLKRTRTVRSGPSFWIWTRHESSLEFKFGVFERGHARCQKSHCRARNMGSVRVCSVTSVSQSLYSGLASRMDACIGLRLVRPTAMVFSIIKIRSLFIGHRGIDSPGNPPDDVELRVRVRVFHTQSALRSFPVSSLRP